jgi:hypothetical protein
VLVIGSIVFFLLQLPAFGQHEQPFTVTGQVSDSVSGAPLEAATASLYRRQIALAFAKTDAEGKFTFKLPDSGRYEVLVRHVGFKPQRVFYETDSAGNLHQLVRLIPDVTVLPSVTITNEKDEAASRDTISFRAADYKNSQTRKVEDLLKNIKGFKVDEDGRISYKGVDVEALLIEDDDLAQDEYGILSKNLDARRIESIDIYKNYHKNRLIGKATRTGKLAVNIKFEADAKGRASGGATAGVGLMNKYEADLNVTYLKNAIKGILLANANNSNYSRVGQLFLSDASPSVAPNDVFEQPAPFNSTGLINLANVSKPPLEERYTNFNGDELAKCFMAGRFSKAISYTGNIGFLKTKAANSALEFINTIVDSSLSWKTQNNYRDARRNQEASLNFALKHDNKRNWAGDMLFQYRLARSQVSYINAVSIDVVDTLTELHRLQAQGFRLGYNSAIKLAKEVTILLQSEVSRVPIRQSFTSITNRWADYWGGIPPFNSYVQQTNSVASKADFRASTYVKRKRSFFVFQLFAASNTLGATNKLVGANSLQSKQLTHQEQREAGYRYGYLLSDFSSSVGKRRLNTTATANFGFCVPNGLLSSANSNPIFLWKLAVKLPIRIFGNATGSFMLLSHQSVPKLEYFIADSFVHTGVSLQRRSNLALPVRQFSSGIALSKPISKINGSAEFRGNFLQSTNVYNIAAVYNPLAFEFSWLPTGPFTDLGFGLGAKSYSFGLKCTFQTAIDVKRSTSNTFINNRNVNNQNDLLSWFSSVVTNFSKKLVFDLSQHFTAFRGTQKANSSVLASSFNQSKTLLKAKWEPTEHLFFGIQVQRASFGAARFWGGDVFGTAVLGKNSSLDWRFQNIFGQRTISTTNASPNFFNQQQLDLVPGFLVVRYALSF